MTPDDSPRVWQRLDDPEAARVVADAQSRRYFEPFIWRERRVTDVAAELGVTRNAMLYQVNKLLRLGLLEVTRTEPRPGRAIRYYRSSSPGYFVPFSATSAESIHALYESSLDNARRSVLSLLTRAWSGLAEDPRWFGLYTYGDAQGFRSHALLPARPAGPPSPDWRMLAWLLEPDVPAVWDNTAPLQLSRAHAKQLQRDLHQLHANYQALKDDASGETYVLRLTLVPVPDEM
ncbi:winged helix-turn-helix domain-containing protein [Deinococcus sonorensis]|uniref:Winged helix-turn-helix domain-containing protein n=2 Tax=Deinococcus sonorensis TaxID=309891 RepID=A0AAU7UFK3_9DEIO